MILGLGNDILTDDAIGLRVVDTLEQSFRGMFDFRKSTLGGLDILEMIKGYDHVVLIDAIRTGGEPGSVFS